jgi:hypothetical protein
VVKAEGVSGVVYRVGKVIQVWVGRGGVVGGVVVKAAGVWGVVCKVGEVSGGARVWTHSATSVTEEVCVAPPSEVYRRVFTPPGDRAFTLDPALTHYRLQRVYVVSSRSERITLTLAHFPLPLFHFAASGLPPPPTPDPSATRPSPTLDSTDLIGRVFNDPDLGLCRVVEVGPPHRLTPGEGNLNPTGPGGEVVWETV